VPPPNPTFGARYREQALSRLLDVAERRAGRDMFAAPVSQLASACTSGSTGGELTVYHDRCRALADGAFVMRL